MNSSFVHSVMRWTGYEKKAEEAAEFNVLPVAGGVRGQMWTVEQRTRHRQTMRRRPLVPPQKHQAIAGDSMGGYVYVMTNKSVRGLVKIGKTKHLPHERAKGLDRAQLPYGYEVRHFVRVPHPHRVEKKVHARLAAFRETRGHEWFRCSIEYAISAVEEIARDAANLLQLDEESRRQKILRAEQRATTEPLRLEQQRARVRAAYEPLMSATTELGPLLWHLRPSSGSRVQRFTDFLATKKATEPALTFTEYRRYQRAIRTQCEALGVAHQHRWRDLATAVKRVYGAIPLSMEREAITKRKQREAKQSATCARKPTAGLTKPKKAK